MKTTVITSLLIATLVIAGWFGYQTIEERKVQEAAHVNAIEEIGHLIDYRELYAEGRSREANDVLLKVVAGLLRAKQNSANIDQLFRELEWKANLPPNYADILWERLRRNLEICKELGIDSSSSIEMMSRGRSPTITIGPHTGEIVHVDHIIPRAHAPEIENLLINLEIVPASVNLKKGDSMDAYSREFEKRLRAEGILE